MTVRIEKIAVELLMEEDCVVIPGFGGFVTHYRPAIFEASKNVIIPPGKSISFNAKLNKNDGLLAQNIASKCSISYNEALKAIEKRVKSWNEQVKKSKFLELENLGSFILNKDGKLVFNQFNESNFANTSFGLTNVNATPIDRLGLSNRIEKSLSNQQAQPKFLKLVKIGTVAASIIFAATLIGLNGKKISNQLDLNPFGLFTNNDSVNAQPEIKAGKSIDLKTTSTNQPKALPNKQSISNPALTTPATLNTKEIEKLEEADQKNTTVAEESTQPINKEVQEINTVPTARKKYHVIAGCFSIQKNAFKMKNSLIKAGYDAEIVGLSKSGLHRVAYGSYSSRVQALKALAKAKRNHNNNAWIAKD